MAASASKPDSTDAVRQAGASPSPDTAECGVTSFGPTRSLIHTSSGTPAAEIVPVGLSDSLDSSLALAAATTVARSAAVATAAHPGSVSSRAPKIPVSVLVVIHTVDGRVLLLERADRPGYWQSVTGSLDTPDEDPAQAAGREVLEETGIALAQGEFYCLDIQNRYEIYAHWRHRYAPGVTHNTEHVFALALSAPCPVQLAPREHLASAWLHWQEAAAHCFSPSNAEAIEVLAKRWQWAPPSSRESGQAQGESL